MSRPPKPRRAKGSRRGYLLRPYDRRSYLVENLDSADSYIVDLETLPWTCTCGDYFMRRQKQGSACKHIGMVWDALMRGKLPPTRSPAGRGSGH